MISSPGAKIAIFTNGGFRRETSAGLGMVIYTIVGDAVAYRLKKSVHLQACVSAFQAEVPAFDTAITDISSMYDEALRG